MRYLIIGDIHGCNEELKNLLNDFSPSPEDVIISIGDIIHKGPNQNAALAIIKQHCNIMILGNHEEKQLRWEYQEDQRELTGRPNQVRAKDYKRLGEENRKWIIEHSKLFLTLEFELGNYILIHGGIAPIINHLPGNNDPWAFSGRDRKFYFQLLRTRFVDPSGRMVSLGEQTIEDSNWAEKYDGRFGHAIFGHQAWIGTSDLFNGPNNFQHALGIDLGCVYGGYLAGLVLDNKGNRSSILIKAKNKYMSADERF